MAGNRSDGIVGAGLGASLDPLRNDPRLELAALVEAASDAIIGKTIAGIITSFNGGAERLFGYSAAEVVGGPLNVLVPSEMLGEAAEILASLEAGRSLDFESVRVRKDGSRIDVWVTSSPILDGTGRVIGASKVVRDISRRKQAELGAVRAEKEAIAANAELEAFSYSVAHDLRAPLRATNGFAHLLATTYGDRFDGEALDWLREITKNANKMAELIDALLVLSKTTRTELHEARVDLTAIAESVFRDLARAEPTRDVVMEVEPGLVTQGDPALLRVLLENLLRNAWKFTSKSSGAKIQVGKTPEGFFVRDNGVGFEMAHAKKLFAPFQRFHSEAEFPGTGIGLATVERIVGRHDGQIRANSRVGAGATFTFTLGEVSR